MGLDVAVQEDPAFATQAKAEHLHNPDAYVLGLEDTRVVRDGTRNNTVYTLSASMEYSRGIQRMDQVLGILTRTGSEDWVLTITKVLIGPRQDRSDKNWVFAGGLDNVVYEWFPAVEIGTVSPEQGTLSIHTTVPAPASFVGMRGSTNGFFYKDQWWFVTHMVIHRPAQMRHYLHRLIVLDKRLTNIERYSVPFTFHADADVEYCLGFKMDQNGLVFGYSRRDRSTWIATVNWDKVGALFAKN